MMTTTFLEYYNYSMKPKIMEKKSRKEDHAHKKKKREHDIDISLSHGGRAQN